MNVEVKPIKVKILGLGEFKVDLQRIKSPKTIDRFMQSLPIKDRAIKQGEKLILPSSVSVQKEKSRNEFAKGDISIDPSSGNITIHLDNSNTTNPENYLGTIEEEIITKSMPITSTVIITKRDE